MQYRKDTKSGNSLSVLGLGCMRLPSDIKKAEALICAACEKGVNYFDTAYLYGKNEEVLGAALEKFALRDKVFIATKLPLALCRGPADFDRFFDKELDRLRTDRIDYYLMHMITDLGLWEKLCSWGIEEWIQKKKSEGKIRGIGFSFHGTRDEFLKVLDAYPWDFCQIQYNYYDENYQAGVTGLKRAAAKGIPVIVMEPLLGGKLSSGLPREGAALFGKLHDDWSPSKWGLLWLWNQEEVTVVLSGMNEMAQLSENTGTAESAFAGCLGGAEQEVFGRVRETFAASYKIRCTACSYCMPCPANVNIPGCFAAYNTSYAIGYITGLKAYMMNAGVISDKMSGPSLCAACGRCERHCPQNIPVIESLKAVRRRLEPFWFRLGISLVRTVLGKGRA
ncbi:MAG: aldo/keto reductase [Spirochaetaceae bacterium]|jgi:predicted aldo/keto reductase-like oxidoreductase|nr:aldo/keto reductase [Spirochaetaceae bacterium]